MTLEPTDDDRTQEAAERIEAALAEEPGVTVGGPAVAQAQVNAKVESDLRRAELLAFPSCSCSRCSSSAASSRPCCR